MEYWIIRYHHSIIHINNSKEDTMALFSRPIAANLCHKTFSPEYWSDPSPLLGENEIMHSSNSLYSILHPSTHTSTTLPQLQVSACSKGDSLT